MLGGSRLAILGWREGKAQGGNPPTELAALTARRRSCTFEVGQCAGVSLIRLLSKDVPPHLLRVHRTYVGITLARGSRAILRDSLQYSPGGHREGTMTGRTHIVSQGDSVERIAVREGLRPETIWEHPKNANLRESGRTLHVLHPGDDLFIPPLRLRTEQCAVRARHRLKVTARTCLLYTSPSPRD